MGVENTKVLHGKLIASKEDYEYITYVFENLDSCDTLHKYLMCVRFPNWDCQYLDIGDCGYVKYREVYAGKDEWYDKTKDAFIKYKFTDVHFLDFIPEKQKQDAIILN